MCSHRRARGVESGDWSVSGTSDRPRLAREIVEVGPVVLGDGKRSLADEDLAPAALEGEALRTGIEVRAHVMHAGLERELVGAPAALDAQHRRRGQEGAGEDAILEPAGN